MADDKEFPLAWRIQSRLKKLNKSERAASLEAGLSASFLRNIRQGKSSSPRADTLEKIAKVLNTNSVWLMTGMGEEETSAPLNRTLTEAGISLSVKKNSEAFRKKHEKKQSNLAETPLSEYKKQSVADLCPQTGGRFYKPYPSPVYDELHESDNDYIPIMPTPYPNYNPFEPEEEGEHIPNALIGGKFALSERRLPVYGQAVGGIDGEFPINGSALYSVLCPPQLSEISEAYAVSISGDSMYPRYEDGEIAFVDPTRRVKKGDYVIAQIMSDEGDPPLAYVKKFIRHNAGGLILEQFNPQKELYFAHDRVVSVHYIALAGTAPA